MINQQNDVISKLSYHLQKNNYLELLTRKFLDQKQLIPKIGVEIEFYLKNKIDIEQFQKLLSLPLKQEKGYNQYEIDLPPSINLTKYVLDINETRLKITQTAKKLGNEAIFLSKPFTNDYGNSMHFHINFLSSENAESCDMIIDQAAKSLCHFMLQTFLVFMPIEEDYLRIDSKFMSPTHISYGGNNRSVAIRIPDLYPKRLEHRLSSALCDPYIAIFAILKSIFLGLENPKSINDYKKIYGQASDEQYNLIPFPKTRCEALNLLSEKFFMDLENIL